MIFSKRVISIILFGTLLAVVSGCRTDNPVEGNETEISDNVRTTGETSHGIYQNVISFKEISGLIAGQDAFVELDIPEFQDPDAAMALAKRSSRSSFDAVAPQMMRLSKSQADSTIWDFTESDSSLGVTRHIKVTYDSQTGLARGYEVKTYFQDSHPLAYDSTTIQSDINFTLLDDSDDKLLSLYNVKRYKSGHLIAEEIGTFTPDDYPAGGEPTGGVLTNVITYSNSNYISETNARFEFHEGEGGSYTKKTEFSDGKSHLEAVTFNTNGTGTFSETRRDGTEISGSFNSADDDGEGSYSKTTTYQDGHDPVSITESGEFTISGPDSTINGTFEKTIVRANGGTESESATVNQTRVGEVVTTTLNVENHDGIGFITITETPNVDQVAGNWITIEGAFVDFNAEAYPDGSAHLEVALYASESAFENGQLPLATGSFDFYPDGSASGTVTENAVGHDVNIEPDGSLSVTDDAS
jgi:hypothetical protein